MQTCDPLNARLWFKLRTPTNWVVAIAVFAVLVFVLQNFIHPLIADAAAIGIAFCIFFFILEKRSIAIICPDCNEYIETNTAWVCGFCQKRNAQTDEFPFINRCEHKDCGQEPKAYQCHHCEELIFFTKDKLKINYAKCVNIPDAPKTDRPVKKDKGVKQHEEKRDLIHELEVTRLKGDLKEAKSKIEPPPKKKTPFEELDEYYKGSVGNEEAARKWKAAIDKEFKNDPDEREKRHRVVDQWVRNRL